MFDGTVSGRILTPDGTVEGYIVLKDGILVEGGYGSPPRGTDPTVLGLMIPGFMNMHTHLGDLAARGDLPSELAKAVHPGGLKDRFFSGAKIDEQIDSYRRAVREASSGVRSIMDFRERGEQGIGIAKEALRGVTAPKVRILGRPGGSEGIEAIVRSCDGVGIPSLSSADPDHRNIVREAGGIYSIHASELYREDVERVLELDPDLVVHMVSGTADDWKAVATAGIPVCVCPRANAAFGIKVPLYEMHRAGLKLVIGTDNAMAVKQDLWREMEAAWLLLRKGGMGGTEASMAVIDMATGRALEGTRIGRRLLPPHPWWEKGWFGNADIADITVLRVPEGDIWKRDPFDHIVRFAGPEDVVPMI